MPRFWVRRLDEADDEAQCVHLVAADATVSDLLQAAVGVLPFGALKAGELVAVCPSVVASGDGNKGQSENVVVPTAVVSTGSSPPITGSPSLSTRLGLDTFPADTTFLILQKPARGVAAVSHVAVHRAAATSPHRTVNSSTTAARVRTTTSPARRPDSPIRQPSPAPPRSMPPPSPSQAAPALKPHVAPAGLPRTVSPSRPPSGVPSHELAPPATSRLGRGSTAKAVPLARPATVRQVVDVGPPSGGPTAARLERLSQPLRPATATAAAKAATRECHRFVAQWGNPAVCDTCKQHQSLHASQQPIHSGRRTATPSAGGDPVVVADSSESNPNNTNPKRRASNDGTAAPASTAGSK